MHSFIHLEGKFKVLTQRNILNSLPKVLAQYQYKNPLYIVDKNVAARCSFLSALRRNKNLLIYNLNQEPSYEYLEHIGNHFRFGHRCDCVCGIGGGSVMDLAKGLAILLKNQGPALSFRGFPILKTMPLPVVTVPSTVGTGSEIIFNASFTDTLSNQKLGINSIDNYPRLTILDPVLAREAPAPVFRSTGCDMLVHIVESYLSLKSTIPSREFSRTAFNFWSEAFPKIQRGSKLLEDWENLQWASIFAMLGLSNSSSGPTGAFSYYLGPVHKIPHGIAGAFFLRHVLKITYQKGDRSLESLSNERKPVLKRILAVLDSAKIPKTLAGLGIKNFDRKEFFEFSRKAAAARRLHSIPFTQKMVEELVEKIS